MEQYILKSQSEMRKVGGGGALILEGEGAVGSSRNAHLYHAQKERRPQGLYSFYNLLSFRCFALRPYKIKTFVIHDE